MSLLMQDELEIEELNAEGFEKILKVHDPKSGLDAILCIHDTTLGPALGGIRIFPYTSFDEAFIDVKRLARGMTYKAALAETATGGGKSVIIYDSKKVGPEKEARLRAFAKIIEKLEGEYIGAEDVGCSLQDAAIIAEETPYMVGLSHDKSSGDPSYFTAWGTFRGIQAAAQKVYGSDSLKGKKIAIQGLGAVGKKLAELLFWEGADLIVADLHEENVKEMEMRFSAKRSSVDDILFAECDILAPCAMGAAINPKTIPKLRCKIVAGCANNQLLNDSDADLLKKKNILYAPDFVINAGGLINVVCELEPEGYSSLKARDKTNQIYEQLLTIFDIAEQNGYSTQEAANSLADYRLKYQVGKRQTPPYFHLRP